MLNIKNHSVMKNIFEIMNSVNYEIRNGEYENAAERFHQALRINPDFAWDSLWIQTPWDFYVALLPFLTSEFDVIHIRSKMACINTMLYLNQFKQALALIAKVESLIPRDPSLLEMRARANAGLGYYYTALKYVEMLEATFDNEYEYPDGDYQVTPLELFKLECLLELGEDTEFEALIGELLTKRLDPDLLVEQSFYLRNCGRYTEGLKAAEMALRIRNTSVVALFQRGWFHFFTGLNATTDFHAFLAAPATPEKGYYLPFVYIYLGQHSKARRSMLQYLSKYPDSPDALYLCSEIYGLLGDTALSIDCLEQAFKHGLVSRAPLYADPALKSVRDTPEGKELIINHLRTLEREDMRAAREISYC